MLRLTITTSFTLAALLLCGNPRRVEAASGDTPITVKDGGSILLTAGGLDAGQTWQAAGRDLLHLDPTGMLSHLTITVPGASPCADQTCGIDTTRHWTVQVNYGGASLTISSVSAQKGVRVRFSRKIPFAQWQKTANPDEREFGHGDGGHISGITVNNGPNLCQGKTGCQVAVIYTVP